MNKIYTLLLPLLLALAIGCGGGTSGTGGVNKQFTGSLTKESGEPIANVSVTILETGAQDTTRADGSYNIATNTSDTDFNFAFQSAEIDEVATVNDVPLSAEVVRVQFTFDEDEQEVEADDVSFEDAGPEDEFCDIFPEDPVCTGEFDDDYCLDFPEDPICDEEFEDDYCFEFPEDPICDESFEDDYCFEFPEDPICDEGFEDDFCLEFPDDPSCFEDDFCIEFPDDPGCFDDGFEDDFCLEFPDDPSCFDDGFDDDFDNGFDDDFEDDFCFEFPDDPSCF